MEAPEPRTDPLQIVIGMEGDVYAWRDACDAWYVFSKGQEGPVEEINGLRFLAIEIQPHTEAVKTHFERLDKATEPNPPMRAVE